MSSHHEGVSRTVSKRFYRGPLGPHMDGFLARLVEEGYALETVRYKRGLLASLSDWLEQRKLDISDIEEKRLRQFLADRYRRVQVDCLDRFTLQQLLGYLRDLGHIARVPQKVDRTALGKLTRDYSNFLSLERGLASLTSTDHLRTMRRFIAKHFKRQPLHLERLRPHHLHRFILREAKRVGRRRIKAIITSLRSFLRFLTQRGIIKTDLAAGLPSVADWRFSQLPKSLPPEDVKRLLDCCDRSAPSGVRNYAILLLLARLGLRAGEVRTLTLDDLDWERGEIVVHGKGGRLDRLPLPKDVGQAVASYLRRGRPPCSTRFVFIRRSAPLRGLGRTAISNMVRRALEHAELNPDFKGAHLLRHSLATNMLRQRATLSEIGQILRHAELRTTQIYAKLDIEALRGIAPPWMGDTYEQVTKRAQRVPGHTARARIQAV